MKFKHLTWMAVALALCVIIFGAFVRLSDAGLGCPDWPGCYGHMTWPTATDDVIKANQAFPERAVEVHKAWKEVTHRILAGVLGLMVLGMFIWAFRKRHLMSARLPFIIGLVITFQAALGMWTVTLKLHPSIVMSHLLGGLLTLSLLTWLACRETPELRPYRYAGHVTIKMVAIGLFLVALQIALGGWTSANYAALACTGFPQCNGQWWPNMDFIQGFNLFREFGLNYEFGVKDGPARIAIQMAHRLGFVVVTSYLSWLIYRLTRNRELLPMAISLAILLALQITLGIVNVTFSLPLTVAVMHNGVAALLLFNLVILLYKTNQSAYN